MNRVRAFLIGALFMAMGSVAGAVGISTISGPQDLSQFTSIMNTMIGQINTQIASWLAFGTAGTAESGEAQFYNNGTWAAPTTSGVTPSFTAICPTGCHTTVQQWLVVVDNNGFVRYIPTY